MGESTAEMRIVPERAALPSKRRVWTGRVIGGLVTALMLLDAALKIARPAAASAAFVRSGWPLELSVPLGLILLASTVLYAIPQTAVLGAILLTGYLGGAVATNLRLGNPIFSQTLFPVYFGVLVWLPLWLRDRRLGELIPLRNSH